ncbi:MAG TPA: ATP-binding protein [Polyangia bacterium]|nr:ATP-binding protein [Polyangia bacterium]
MKTPPALALELSCRYLTPLLDIIDQEKCDDQLFDFLKQWDVSRDEIADQSNWVSLRFCESLVEWLGAEIGGDQLAQRVTRAVFSPKALGFMYPLLRAIGSARLGYSRLPQVVSMLNKVSSVRVSNLRRGAAEIEYRPAAPQYSERSPLICQLRKAQIAAGPTLWSLPPARVDESSCQAKGDDSCRYRISWLERAPLKGTLLGIAAGILAYLAAGHGVLLAAALVVAGGALGRLWDVRAYLKEMQRFIQAPTTALQEAIADAEERFLELQKAKAEVDVRVEERTAALKIATEKRIHTEKLAVLGTLAAGLAHEVRNPASAIVSGLRPVKRHLESLNADQDCVRMVDIAIEAAEQISGLVGNLLDMGRTDRGLEPWDPNQGIEIALRLLSYRTEGVDFERKLEYRGQILGRPPALNQIFLNLFDNAIRAAGDGGRVRVASRPENLGVEITVADSGRGVPPDVAPLIFDPFFTTREVGDGVGLGLHFSRQVAYDHGGTLDLVSAPGWGACFRLWLPAQPVEAPPP